MSLASLLFKNQNLISFEVPFDDGVNGQAVYRWGANCYVTVLVQKEHSVKLDLFALFSVEAVDENLLVFLYLVLVPCDLYDCIHEYRFFPTKGRQR